MLKAADRYDPRDAAASLRTDLSLREPSKIGLANLDTRSREFDHWVQPSSIGPDSARSSAFTSAPSSARLLYSAEQRAIRDRSIWTLVQGVLAPLQFLAFVVSLACVVHYLATGTGLLAANISVLVKTATLYSIMIAGCIWEREVFGVYLFARPFFWEDVFSILVLALHTAYVYALVANALTAHQLMILALVAYASYAINAAQFLLKMRQARLEVSRASVGLVS